MSDLYEILEMCLNEIEQGADMETVLFHHSEFASELRPILETSQKAREMSVPSPSQEIVRRNRAKLLQHAAEMRERKAAPASRRVWSVPLRRALVTLMVILMLSVSGTGLVRASSNTLPGDNLYPVKRTWEDVQVFFTFNQTSRQELELEQETERLDEVHELFAEGRSAQVDFAGYVTSQAGTEWRVSGITVLLQADTRLPAQPVIIGEAVRVHGHIQNDSVLAVQVELLPSGLKLPEVEDNESDGHEGEENEGSSLPIMRATSTEVENEASGVVESATPKVENESESSSLEGVVSSIDNNFIIVDNTVLNIESAELDKLPVVGSVIKVEGYYDSSGTFVVTKLEIKEGDTYIGDSSSSESSSPNTNDSTSSDDHHDDGGAETPEPDNHD